MIRGNYGRFSTNVYLLSNDESVTKDDVVLIHNGEEVTSVQNYFYSSASIWIDWTPPSEPGYYKYQLWTKDFTRHLTDVYIAVYIAPTSGVYQVRQPTIPVYEAKFNTDFILPIDVINYDNYKYTPYVLTINKDNQITGSIAQGLTLTSTWDFKNYTSEWGSGKCLYITPTPTGIQDNFPLMFYQVEPTSSTIIYISYDKINEDNTDYSVFNAGQFACNFSKL